MIVSKKTVMAGVLLSACITGLFAFSAQGDPRLGLPVVLITSDSLNSTSRAVYGAKKVISEEHPDIEFINFLVTQDKQTNEKLAEQIRNNHPLLVLTVGSAATAFAKEHFPQIPIVFGAVKYPVLSGFVESFDYPGGNITGASLDIPDEIQFKYFKKIIPRLEKLGVIYTKNTQSLISQANIIAKEMGIKLIPIMIDQPDQLAAAVDSISRCADGIWSVADMGLFNSKSTKFIISNTLRRRIPFMGFSRNVVESGALFSLDFDYKAVGFQTGIIANRILNGENPRDIKITTSDLIWFHYNEKTAQHIGIALPEELMAVAREVYR